MEKSDNELMNEFKNGSLQSFNEIFYRYKDRIYNYVYWSILRNDFLSQEVTQLTAIHIWEYKYYYKDNYKFSTWVYTIARNLAYDALRQKNRSLTREISFYQDNKNESISNMNDAESLIDSLDKERSADIIKKTIIKLKQKYCEVIMLRYIEEMSYKEISSILGKKESTVKSIAARGLDLLKNNCNLNGLGY
jgi:RNA polymerase sigma-70 factor (ECF subfamily)